MIKDPHVLLKFLYDNPRAWPVRMALIEELVRDGEVDRAKSIIRESPADCPMPPEYPARIHALMTRGIDGLADFPPLVGFEEREEPEPEEQVDNITPVPPASSSSATLDELETLERSRHMSDQATKSDLSHEPSFDFEERVGEISDSGELLVPSLKGGAGALVENKTIKRQLGPKPPAPTIDQEIAAIKWEEYSGKLHLTDGEIPESVGKPSRFSDRISAMSLAIVAHCIAAVVISLVVINTPRPNPPKLVVTMPDVYDSDDLIVHRLTKPAEKEPSAAAAQAVNVLTSIQMSSFSLPEVEDTTALDVTAMIDGAAEIGAGMRLSLDTHQQSDVNFFGISSGGKKIVFVIDATKPMLVDEKGGMFAYNKVKEEIGAMLVNLNRGTKFNIMVYSGKMVRAFREEMVPGLPSNIRMAMEWMAPLNADYNDLGLKSDFGFPIEVEDLDGLPIKARDVAHYTKCIQKAMEWQAAAIFCISGGYESMRRTYDPEVIRKMRQEMMEDQEPRQAPPLDPADKARYERDRAKWNEAIAKTREWLRKENEARAENGVSPKVVLNFNELVLQITGQSPPRPQARIRSDTPTRNNNRLAMEPLKPIEFDDIDAHIRKLVIANYLKKSEDAPSVHMVIFLGEDEDLRVQDKDHFGRIVKRNHGKMKMLRGLAALQDVTGN